MMKPGAEFFLNLAMFTSRTTLIRNNSDSLARLFVPITLIRNLVPRASCLFLWVCGEEDPGIGQSLLIADWFKNSANYADVLKQCGELIFFPTPLAVSFQALAVSNLVRPKKI